VARPGTARLGTERQVKSGAAPHAAPLKTTRNRRYPVAKKKASTNGSEGGVATVEDEVVRRVRVNLLGVAPYSQSQAFRSEKRNREGADEYDERCWKERAHFDEDGFVCVPGTSIYLALLQAAQFRGDKIAGRGNKTYADRFAFGVQIEEPLLRLAPEIHQDDLQGERRFVPADGNPAYKARGASKRVWRRFPFVPPGWRLTVPVVILDELVTDDVFEKHLVDAGKFIGIGRFRPASRGWYGRFAVESFDWQ